MEIITINELPEKNVSALSGEECIPLGDKTHLKTQVFKDILNKFSKYETVTHAKSTYQPVGDYETTAHAVKTYQQVGNYETIEHCKATYQPIGNYDTVEHCSATYQPIGDYALKEEIPDISGLETSEHAADTYQKQGDYATKEYCSETYQKKGNYQLIDNMPDLTVYETIEHASNTYQPKNDYETVLHASSTYQEKGDYELAYHAANTFAKKEDIPDISGLETSEHASETYQVKGDYATKDDIPTLTGCETVEHAASTYQVKGDYALKSDIPSLSGYETSSHASSTYQVKGDYALKSEIPNVSGFETSSHASSTYALKSDIPDLSGYETSSHASQTYLMKGDYAYKSDIIDYNNISEYTDVNDNDYVIIKSNSDGLYKIKVLKLFDIFYTRYFYNSYSTNYRPNTYSSQNTMSVDNAILSSNNVNYNGSILEDSIDSADSFIFKNHNNFDSLCSKLDLDYYIGYHEDSLKEDYGLYDSDFVHSINLKTDTSKSDLNDLYADVCLLYYIWENQGRHHNVAMNHYHRYFDIEKMSAIEPNTVYSMLIVDYGENLYDSFNKLKSEHPDLNCINDNPNVQMLLELRGYTYNFKNDNIFLARESFITSREIFNQFMTEFDSFLQDLQKTSQITTRYIFEILVSVIMHNIIDKYNYKLEQGPKLFISLKND